MEDDRFAYLMIKETCLPVLKSPDTHHSGWLKYQEAADFAEKRNFLFSVLNYSYSSSVFCKPLMRGQGDHSLF